MSAALRKVLIADDEPSLRLLIQATIASDEYVIIEAADGDEAWALMQRERPAVALLDVQMPGKTGLDVARAIRGDAHLADTQIILLTAQAQQASIEAGLASGADFYLTKPFSPLELLTTVERALQAARTRVWSTEAPDGPRHDRGG
jgi:CheY-like chemotaxis protein